MRGLATILGLTVAVVACACRSDDAEQAPAEAARPAPAEPADEPAEQEPPPAEPAPGPAVPAGGPCQGADACFDAARTAEQAGAPEAALQLYQRACDADGAQACARLGHMYRLGKGTAADEARGLDYLQRACRLGSPGACDALGH
jgi:TPR repeat protein